MDEKAALQLGTGYWGPGPNSKVEEIRTWSPGLSQSNELTVR